MTAIVIAVLGAANQTREPLPLNKPLTPSDFHVFTSVDRNPE
jgi:hypothetical protein